MAAAKTLNIGVVVNRSKAGARAVLNQLIEFSQAHPNLRLHFEKRTGALVQRPGLSEVELAKKSDLLLVADCVPFALADFHTRFLRGRPVVIGCPKLDQAEFYVRKLTDIISAAGLRSITVIHMEVPCCSGLTRIAQEALAVTGDPIPLKDVTISIQGNVLD